MINFTKKDIPVIPLEKNVAKTYKDGIGLTLLEHSITTAFVAKNLIPRLSPDAQKLLPKSSITQVAIHDVGKCTWGFQYKILRVIDKITNLNEPIYVDFLESLKNIDPNGRSSIHNFGSYKAALNYGLSSTVAHVLGAHHGSKIIEDELVSYIMKESWNNERNRLISNFEEKFGIIEPITELEGLILTGLTTFSDWVASDDNNFNPDVMKELEDEEELNNKCNEILDKIGWDIDIYEII